MPVTQFYRIEDERKNYIFRNKPVQIQRENGSVPFPCIALYRKGAVETPVWYPRYERWYIPVDKAQIMAATTLRKRSIVICAFLNHILWNTNHSYLHDITLNDIRQFFLVYQTKENGQSRSAMGWNEGTAFVADFLASYYIHNCDTFDFAYKYQDLIEEHTIRNTSTGRTMLVNQYNHLSVKAPEQLTKKNRLLLYGYLDFILLECEMYDPELTLAVALQAFAGLREGEIVNLSYNRIELRYEGFGSIGDIILDLTRPASFAAGRLKTEFGNIKIKRKQSVYPDFIKRVQKLYNAHMARHEAMGYKTGGDAPVFVNKKNGPMSVDTYKGRVKKLFYEHFLPDLRKASEQTGNWATDAPYIEAFEEDYPGAHAFRHWFTMYLFQKAKLTTDEISKWRGDSSRESMLTYIHVNADMLASFETTTHTFQRTLLEEIL